jgi:hypothetical protein
MKTLVYTAIFGDKDEAPILMNRDDVDLTGFDFLCITDNPNLKSSDYDIVQSTPKYSDVTKNARDIKINGIENIGKYDVAIWHDSSVRLHADQLQTLAESGKKHMIAAFHHRRYCAYLEAIACIDQRKDSPIRIVRQMLTYFKEGFPANFKLHETTIMVINPVTFFGSDLQSTWWTEIVSKSRRDQLSLAYARWKTHTEVALLADPSNSGFSNGFSTCVGHRHARYEHTGSDLDVNLKFVRLLCKKLIYIMRGKR